ncbi:MAG: NPCBM/NEW2 domain-containing protein [Clostridia bacterium]|nr:NPCBM/NEW2 domain-containing protein [Clostridia bacterium]
MRRIIRCFFLIVVTWLILFSISACSKITNAKSVKDFISFVEKGDIQKASEVYDKKISGDGDAMTNANRALSEMIDTTLTKYKNDEWDYYIAHSRLESIAVFPGVSENALLAMEKIDQTNTNNELLSSSKQLLADENYKDAILLLEKIPSTYEKHEDVAIVLDNAKTAYKDSITKSIRTHLENKQFLEAELELTDAEELLGISDDFITLEESIDIAEKKDIIERAQVRADSNDYADALSMLQNAMIEYREDADINQAICKIGTEYVSVKLSEAEHMKEEKNYVGAVAVLNQANAIYPDSTLAKTILDYNKYIPASLTAFEVFYNGFDKYERTVENTLRDKMGNTYTDCILYAYGYETGRHEVYILGRQYSRFTGTIFVPDNRGSDNDEKCYFRIYGDENLMYASPNLPSTAYPVDIDIDVTGVDQLKIQYFGGALTWKRYSAIGNPLLYMVTDD